MLSKKEPKSVAMKKQGTILVAEDSDNDALLLQFAFEKAGVSNPVWFVRDGQEAVDYLKGEGQYIDRDKFPCPLLMILDLKMPRMDGFDVLSWCSKNERFCEFPIIVLSTSNLDQDIQRAMELGAAGYSVKPADFSHLVSMARILREQWLENGKKGNNTGL
jgi:CheY-like chemotaxis protein